MNGPVSKLARCAIYTRKSTEHNLDLSFNSLDAQREACEASIKSQVAEGCRLIPDHYDDGAFSGASLERPALQALLADVRARKVDAVVVYKVVGSGDRDRERLAGCCGVEWIRTNCSSASRCSGKTITGSAANRGMVTSCLRSGFVMPQHRQFDSLKFSTSGGVKTSARLY